MYFLSTSIGDFGAMPHPCPIATHFFYVGGDPSGHGAVAQTLGLCVTSEIEMSCFIVSKAALKSTGIRVVPCLLSVDVLLALVTYSSAVSVGNFFFRFAD